MEWLSIGLLAATLRVATPLIYAAIGTLFSERSGVMNIGVEGMMLFGAFTAVAGSYYTAGPWIGVAAAVAVGALLGLLHAWACVTLGANQIVSGAAINLLAVGIPNYLLLALWNRPGVSPLVAGIEPIRLPLADSMPLVGGLFDALNPLVYGAFALALAAHFLLFKTPLGLRIRAVGEHPRAADTVGVRVERLRYLCVVLSGALAGLAGAYLSVAHLSLFTKQMTQGRGFIAMAAMIFGKWTPLGTLGACLLFGLAEALQLSLQTQELALPADLLMALPYLVTLLALAGFVGRARAPAAIGRPYRKDA